MNILKLTGGAAATLAMMGLAVPAEAQRYRGADRGHHGKRHHRGGDKIDAGDVILGAILLGGILAIGDSAKKRRERAEAAQVDYDADTSDASEYDGTYNTESAADRCASEAETLAQSYARLTRVSSISSTTWSFGKWIVKGKVDLADSEDDSAARSHKFRCELRAGSQPSVTFEGL